jgi:hypothetical protein
MTKPAASILRVGEVFEIVFPRFTSHITIRSESELTVEIVAGYNAGFSDTMGYEAHTLRDEMVFLTWQEHNRSTIVHVLDFSSGEAHTAVTPANGEFMRMRGRIEMKSPLNP